MNDNQKKQEVINRVVAQAERNLAERGQADELVQMTTIGDEVYLKANDIIKFLSFQLTRPTLTNADRNAVKKIRSAIEGFNEHGMQFIGKHDENFHGMQTGDTVYFIGEQIEGEEPRLVPGKNYHVHRLVMGTMSNGVQVPCLELVEYGPGHGFIVTMFEKREAAAAATAPPDDAGTSETKVIGIDKTLQ